MNQHFPQSVESLAQALLDEDDELQQDAACQALQVATIGPHDAAAVPALISALDSDRETIRQVAATSLEQIGSAATAAIEPLAFTLKRERSDACREAIVEALRRIGTTDTPAAIEAVECLMDDDFYADPFLEYLHEQGPTAIAQALATLSMSGCIGAVCWCRDTDKNLLVDIFRNAELQKEGAVDYRIMAALDDLVWRGKMAWDHEVALQILVAALERPDGDLKQQAIEILNKLSCSVRKSVPEHLRGLLSQKDDEV